MNDKQKKSERDFLHDLATPLGTAIFLLSSMMDDRPPLAAGEFDQLGEIHKALVKLNDLLVDRRQTLMAETSKAAE